MSARSLRVLLVEQDEALAEAVTVALRRRGHVVTATASPHDALSSGPYDVIVCDVDLPGASGIQLIERLRARGELGGTIFVSNEPTFEACRRAMRLGAAEFFPKPFSMHELCEAVERATEPRAPLPAGAPTDDCFGERGRSSFRRTYAAQPTGVDRAVRDVAALALQAGIGPTTRTRIATACCEVLDNASRHAYPGLGEPSWSSLASAHDSDARIEVEAEVATDELRVVVRDYGCGFDYARAVLDAEQAVDAPDPENVGGLARAAALAESIRFQSGAPGTRVTLVFALSRRVLEEAPSIELSELDYLRPETARRVVSALRHGNACDMYNLSPAMAVTIGRILAGRTPDQVAQATLWS